MYNTTQLYTLTVTRIQYTRLEQLTSTIVYIHRLIFIGVVYYYKYTAYAKAYL